MMREMMPGSALASGSAGFGAGTVPVRRE